MISIQDAVTKIISQKGQLVEYLEKGLINITALAKEIKPQVEEITMKNCGTPAIIMAITRGKFTVTNSQRVGSILKSRFDILTRTSIVEYNLRPDVFSKIGVKKIDYETLSNLVFVFTRGIEETTVILPQSHEADFLTLVDSADILARFDKLATITIVMNEDIVTTNGVYYQILKALAWKEINIVELASTMHELTLVVAEEQLEDVFTALRSFQNYGK